MSRSTRPSDCRVEKAGGQWCDTGQGEPWQALTRDVRGEVVVYKVPLVERWGHRPWGQEKRLRGSYGKKRPGCRSMALGMKTLRERM